MSAKTGGFGGGWKREGREKDCGGRAEGLLAGADGEAMPWTIGEGGGFGRSAGQVNGLLGYWYVSLFICMCVKKDRG